MRRRDYEFESRHARPDESRRPPAHAWRGNRQGSHLPTREIAIAASDINLVPVPNKRVDAKPKYGTAEWRLDDREREGEDLANDRTTELLGLQKAGTQIEVGAVLHGEQFAKELGRAANATALSVVGNHHAVNGATVVLPSLQAFEHLRCLALCNLSLGAEGLAPLRNKEVAVRLHSLRIEGCPSLAPGSLAPLQECENLRLLSLAGCRSLGDAALGWALAAQRLQTLILDGTHCTDRTLRIATFFLQLQRLSLKENLITTTGLALAVQKLKLTHLRLRGCSGLCVGVENVLGRCSSLKHVDLAGCGLPQELPKMIQENHMAHHKKTMMIGECDSYYDPISQPPPTQPPMPQPPQSAGHAGFQPSSYHWLFRKQDSNRSQQ